MILQNVSVFTEDERLWIVTHYLLYEKKPTVIQKKFVEEFHITVQRGNLTYPHYFTRVYENFLKSVLKLVLYSFNPKPLVSVVDSI